MCTHIESIWTKTNSPWKRHNADEGSSSHHYFFLCCFFEFEQATPGQKLYPLVSFFFSFFLFSHFSKTLRWKTYVAYSDQVEREEDEHIHYGNFKAFSHYILNTTRVLASFEVQDFFDCAFKCIAKAACFSLNIAILPSANFYSYACHLLASDKYNDSSQFLQSQEFHHFAIVVSFNWLILNFQFRYRPCIL